ncbi:glycosyltransferase family 4 protein [Corynebacterium cystitidis]|uniref:glycosyltransferase family 4 protein n=1 Tax=Corynebacterium cystitidis TaxID=35757 RepID=UPI00211EE0F4|nr:glycosyltransferase family 4 protein [Corynebacterium cystitidis]
MIFLLRVGALAFSAIAVMAAEDPSLLRTKIAEKLRIGKVKALQPLARLIRPRAEKHQTTLRQWYERGEYQRVADAKEFEARSERHLQTLSRGKVAQLDTPIIPSKPLTKSARPTKPTVLFFLTNSLPYTTSGYTHRSQKLLEQLQLNTIEAKAVTRLAYPVVIGEIPSGQTQVVNGVAYRRLIPWYYPRTSSARIKNAVDLLTEYAQEISATHLHTTTDYKNAIVVSQAANRLEIPWVYEVRGELENTWLARQPDSSARESYFYQRARAKEVEAMASAAAVVALSEVSKQSLMERGVAADKIIVIPNGVDKTVLAQPPGGVDTRAALGLPKGPLMGTVTSVVDYEGLDTFLHALVDLPDVSGVIVGDGVARPWLEQLARKLQISQRVFFMGNQQPADINQWYQALDVFVLPRRDIDVTRTVTPIKALTAQALGIPVVASDLPALVEVTGGLETYVPAGNAHALSDALRRVLAENGRFNSKAAQRQARLAQPERQQWLQARTWDALGARLAGLYTN